jgi:hypothetical protein
MTPSFRWVPDDSPSVDKTPFVPALRFTGTGKVWRVWLLADVRCMAVHYQPGQKTQPCLAESGECPYCKMPTWWERTEAYVPAMLEIKKLPDPSWQPILAILTKGCAKQMGVKPHRGKMFDLERATKGSRCTPLNAKLVQVSDPLRPSFDIEPLIRRLWWATADIGAVELPEPIPIPVEEVHREPFVPVLQPLMLTEEEKTRMREQAQRLGLANFAAKIGSPEPDSRSHATEAVPAAQSTPTSATQPTTSPPAAVVEPATLDGLTIKPEPGVLSGTLVKAAGPDQSPQTKPAPTKPLPQPRVSMTQAALNRIDSTLQQREAGDRQATVGDLLPKILNTPSNGQHTNGTEGGTK